MRRKKTLNDKRNEINEEYWEEDSKYEHWENFYIDFYKSCLKGLVDFNELTYYYTKRNSEYIYRVAVKVNPNIPDISNFMFSGDVIINLDNIPKEYRQEFEKIENKYQYCNLGLLPKEGNLQGGKKKAGNDWKLHVFLQEINDYYCGNNNKLLYHTKIRNNQKQTITILDVLGSSFDESGNINFENDKKEKIYHFCDNLYGISRSLVNEFLSYKEETPKTYYDLICKFWEERTLIK